jgi:hypothetical protein
LGRVRVERIRTTGSDERKNRRLLIVVEETAVVLGNSFKVDDVTSSPKAERGPNDQAPSDESPDLFDDVRRSRGVQERLVTATTSLMLGMAALRALSTPILSVICDI